MSRAHSPSGCSTAPQLREAASYLAAVHSMGADSSAGQKQQAHFISGITAMIKQLGSQDTHLLKQEVVLALKEGTFEAHEEVLVPLASSFMGHNYRMDQYGSAEL